WRQPCPWRSCPRRPAAPPRSAPAWPRVLWPQGAARPRRERWSRPRHAASPLWPWSRGPLARRPSPSRQRRAPRREEACASRSTCLGGRDCGGRSNARDVRLHLELGVEKLLVLGWLDLARPPARRGERNVDGSDDARQRTDVGKEVGDFMIGPGHAHLVAISVEAVAVHHAV